MGPVVGTNFPLLEIIAGARTIQVFVTGIETKRLPWPDAWLDVPAALPVGIGCGDGRAIEIPAGVQGSQLKGTVLIDGMGFKQKTTIKSVTGFL